MHENTKHWELKVSWQRPFHQFNIIGYKVFKKHLGRVDRGGYCVTENKINEDACLEEWTSASEELETTGELVFETAFTEETEFIDTVEETGIWRYAVYGIYTRHMSQNVNTYTQLTLCSTNTYFIKDTFTLQVISPHGKVEGSFRNLEGEYNEIQLVSIENGYKFTGWEMENYEFENPMATTVKVFMNQDLTITANYEALEYDVNLLSYQGEVSTDVNGKHTFGSIIQIHAYPDDHNTFLGWQGENISDIREESTELLITGDMDVLGLFRYNKYDVTLDTSGYGEIIGGGKFHYGDIVPIKAVSGYNPTTFEPSIFRYWRASDANMVKIFNGSKNSTFIQVLGPVTLTAVFEERKYLITITGYNGFEVGTGEYYLDDIVNIRAVPDPGFTFEGWEVLYGNATIDDASSLQTTVTVVNEDTKILAKYTAIEYNVSIEESEGGNIKLEYFGVEYDSYNFTYQNIVELNPHPDPGWFFLNYEQVGDPEQLEGAIIENTLNPGQSYFVVGLGDAKIKGVFIQNFYKLSISGDYGFETINDGGSTFEGPTDRQVEIKSIPRTGYEFSGWTMSGEGSILDPTRATTIFTIGVGNASIVANYSVITYEANIDGDGYEYFLLDDLQEVSSLEKVPSEDIEIYARANPGYTFGNWLFSKGFINDVNANPAIYTFTNSDADISAEYTAIDYSVNLSGDGNQKILFNGAETDNRLFNIDNVLTIVGEAPSGYVFSNWVLSGKGEIDDLNASETSFTVSDGNALIKAVYIKKEAVDLVNDSDFYTVKLIEGTDEYDSTRYYFVGDQVTFKIDIVSGYTFNGIWTFYHSEDKEGFWEQFDPVTLNDITFNADMTEATFSMPNYPVTIDLIPKSETEPIIIGDQFSITVTCPNSEPAEIVVTDYSNVQRTIRGSGAIRAGEEVRVVVALFTNYYFTNWVTTDGVELSEEDLVIPHIIEFIMPPQDVSLEGNSIRWDTQSTSSTAPETLSIGSFSSTGFEDMILINNNGVGVGDSIFEEPFFMGKLGFDDDAEDDEIKHSVQLSFAFYMGKYQVTQKQFQEIMGYNPSIHKGDNKPVENVTWQEVTEFCDKLTVRERELGNIPYFYAYALPTESEWEYVCRAGTRSRFYTGADVVNLTERENSLTKVVSSGVQSIAAGENHSVFMKTDGTVWGMGDNSSGQLGQPEDVTFVVSPVQITSGATAVFAEEECTFVIKSGGTVWATGSNKYGKLGVGKDGNPQSANTAGYTPFLYGFEQVVDNNSSPLSNIDKVVNCKYASFFKTATGGVYASGTDNGVGLIQSGSMVKSDWAIGERWWDNKNDTTAYKGKFFTGAIRIWDDDATTNRLPSVEDLAVTDSSAHFLLSSGYGLWSSGYNSNGVIGNPYFNNPSKSYQARYSSYRPIPWSPRKRSDKTFVSDIIWSYGGGWEIYSGSNNHVYVFDHQSLLGSGGPLAGLDAYIVDNVFYHPSKDIRSICETSKTNITTVLGGTASANKIFTWSKYGSFVAADGSTETTQNIQELDLSSIFGANTAIDVVAGGDHILFLTDNGELWAQGSNSHGQLGTIVDITKYSIGNYNASSTMPVGSFEANPWGFYDMPGNVSEWVLDYDNSYGSKDAIDPIISTPSNPRKIARVTRGGSFKDSDDKLRSSSRDSFSVQDCDKDETVGFRLALRYWTAEYKDKASWTDDDERC